MSKFKYGDLVYLHLSPGSRVPVKIISINNTGDERLYEIEDGDGHVAGSFHCYLLKKMKPCDHGYIFPESHRFADDTANGSNNCAYRSGEGAAMIDFHTYFCCGHRECHE